jgi:hypothetical protein
MLSATRNVLLAVLAGVLLSPGLAFADETFAWTFASTAGGISGIGTLTAVADPSATPGLYDITGGSGTVTSGGGPFGVTIEPCINYAATCTFTNTDGHGANLQVDNLLYLNHVPGSELDGYGIALAPGPPGSGASQIGIWDFPSQYFYNYTFEGNNFLSTPFTVSAVPEPGSVTLLVAMLVVLRKKLASVFL